MRKDQDHQRDHRYQPGSMRHSHLACSAGLFMLSMITSLYASHTYGTAYDLAVGSSAPGFIAPSAARTAPGHPAPEVLVRRSHHAARPGAALARQIAH